MTIKNDLQMAVSVPNEDVEEESDTLWDQRCSASMAAGVLCISSVCIGWWIVVFLMVGTCSSKRALSQDIAVGSEVSWSLKEKLSTVLVAVEISGPLILLPLNGISQIHVPCMVLATAPNLFS